MTLHYRINTKLSAKDIAPMRDLIPEFCDGIKLIQVRLWCSAQGPDLLANGQTFPNHFLASCEFSWNL